jgi:hypothetical protein
VEAYESARRAPSAPTFNDAREILNKIDLEGLTDKDLKDHIRYMLDVCNLCIELGIPSDTSAGIRSLLASLDYRAVYAALVKKGLDNIIPEAKRLFAEASRLYAGIDRYEEVDELHRRRYEEPERAEVRRPG